MKKSVIAMAIGILLLISLSGCQNRVSDHQIAFENCRQIQDYSGGGTEATLCAATLWDAYVNSVQTNAYYTKYAAQVDGLLESWGFKDAVGDKVHNIVQASCSCSSYCAFELFGVCLNTVNCCTTYCPEPVVPGLNDYNPHYISVPPPCSQGQFCTSAPGIAPACSCTEQSCQAESNNHCLDGSYCVQCVDSTQCNQPAGETCVNYTCQGPAQSTCQQGGSFFPTPPLTPPIFGTNSLIRVYIDPSTCANADIIDVKVDDIRECILNKPPMIYECTFDTTQFQNGSHTLTAMANKGLDYFIISRTIQICNDAGNDCVSDEPVCPAACAPGQWDDPATVSCGKYPKQCCMGGSECDSTNLIQECRSANPPMGTGCSNGVCDAQTHACVCPSNCVDAINPATHNCGDSISLPAGCSPSVCTLPSPSVGNKCSDALRRCAFYDGRYACWSADKKSPGASDAVQCTDTIAPLNQDPSTVRGLYCDNFQDQTHGLCDWTNSPNCKKVLDTTQFAPKYNFSIGVEPQNALVFNTWFQFRFNDSVPTITPNKLYCLTCSQQPGNNAYTISLTNADRAPVKEGIMRVRIGNQKLFGPFNYAAIQVQDLIDSTKSNGQASGTEKTETMIVKLNAGYSGKCVSEDRSFLGETGPEAVPKIKYDWSWGGFESKKDFCDPNKNPGAVYCDSTQFTIALLGRLKKMQDLADSGHTGEAAALQDFGTLMMKDGFSQDFLLDFNYYAAKVDFQNTPQWYLLDWSKYFGSTPRISFNPVSITEPGLYSVHLQLNWNAGKQWKFFENGVPQANIVIQLAHQSSPSPMNPLYLMPFDARLGETDGTRNGYGTLLAGDPLPLSSQFSALTMANGNIQSRELKDFNETNLLPNRGRLLTVNAGNAITFSPVNATPIAMKIQDKDNQAQAFYSVREGSSKVKLGSDQSIGAWTGIGSQEISPACTGFDGTPLYFLRSDEKPIDNSCSVDFNHDRGFRWGNTKENETVFFETVLYTPRRSASTFSLVTECIVPAEWVSPAEILSSQNAGQPMSLDYSKKILSIDSMQDVLDGVKFGYVCQHIDGASVTFYWDRNSLLQQLEPSSGNPYNLASIGLQSPDRCTQ